MHCKIGDNVLVHEPRLNDLWIKWFVGTVKQIDKISGLGTIYKIKDHKGKYFGMKHEQFDLLDAKET